MPSKSNPRRSFDPETIAKLAVTIQSEGLLQNLVVRPLKRRKKSYELVAGERRWRALCLLQERGDLPDDYQVPVIVRKDLSDADALRLGTVENVQRENLHPLDEAAAWAALLQGGAEVEDLEAQTGLSTRTIKRRLALTGLSEPAQAALREGTLSLSQAQALTLGSHTAQDEFVERIADGWHYDAEDIRDTLVGYQPSVAMAVFPLERYTGTLTRDLFADDDSTYFDDDEQFMQLQRQAVEELAAQHAETAAWVEVIEESYPSWWHYEKADEGEPGGVVLHFAPTGNVEVREGLIKREMTPRTLERLQEADQPKPPKPAYSTTLCRYLAHQKSIAVQAQLLAHRRKAKEVAVVMMLGGGDLWQYWQPPLKLTLHSCLEDCAKMDEAPSSYGALEQAAQPFVAKLRAEDPPDDGDERPAWQRLLGFHRGDLYVQVQALSDADLDALHLMLPVLCFGQGNIDQLDTELSFFNRVAQDLGLDMRAHWRPDATFLSRRTRAQLQEIAQQSGAAAKLTMLDRMKKAELVEALAKYFAPSDGQADAPQGQAWLPGVMEFPAVEQEGGEATAVAAPGEADSEAA